MQVNSVYEFGAFRLTSSPALLLRDGKPVAVSPKALELLIMLVRNSGNLVTKEELIQAAWPDTFVEEGNLTQNISLLRKALGKDPENHPYIETMSKRGYRFAAPVRLLAANTMPVASAQEPVKPWRWPTALAISIPTVILAGIAVYALLPIRVSPVRTVAVLPLENLSGDPGQDYFADGFSEALTGELGKIRSLRVISRPSAMRYRGTGKPIPQIARELHADALVVGSVIRSGDRATIRVQLIRGSSDEHLWSESYERPVQDVPSLNGEVALAVARQLRVSIQPELQTAPVRRPLNRDAFEAYLKGRYAWNKRTPGSVLAAKAHFLAAIDADPVYAPAYAGLADCYHQLGTAIIGESPPTETRPLAVAAARKALEIDHQLSEAHAALAYADLYNWNWERAEQGFRTAIDLNPSNSSAHLWFSHYLAARNRFPEALQEVYLSRDLDPLSPIIATQVGWILHHMRRYEEAIAQYQKVVAENPDYIWAWWQIGMAYTLGGRHPEAIEALEKAWLLSKKNPIITGTLAMAYGSAGQKKKAAELLAELNELAHRRYVTPAAFENVYLGLGNEDAVFHYLEMSYKERRNGLAHFAVWPAYDKVRETPRGQDLLRRLGLAR